ncbi:hypothetical protein CAEBREN_20585 [Caenorhabditis brenneri]|uniref:Uncharacterized protein n=1 Tax=Caenorhabditis brenneri TaxID=135651 RepID=G0P3T9_CAEBE|nr:hypothetical protein CAEBREN_20585 [Caenorhabditis brenneri]
MRRSFQSSIVNQSNIPVQHVFRWIEGWIASLDGYRHIEHITYRHPSFHVKERVQTSIISKTEGLLETAGWLSGIHKGESRSSTCRRMAVSTSMSIKKNLPMVWIQLR